MQSETPIYVIANGTGFRQGLTQIAGSAAGGSPTLTYLFDLASAPQGQVTFATGIAWDRTAEHLVVSSHGGFAQALPWIDLAAQTAPLLFQDALPVQIQGFALRPNSVGDGKHLGSTDVLQIAA